MGWLNTLLDVGILSVQVSQSAKLEEMKRQGSNAEAIQALLHVMRNEVFSYKQAAQKALALEPADERAAATAMLLIERQYDDLGLTPELFPDFVDKEKVAETESLIVENSARLLAQLDPATAQAVRGDVDAVLQLPKYEFYIDHYEDVANYRAAKAEVNRLGTKNSGCLQVIGFFILLGFVPMICGSVGLVFNEGFALFGILVGVVLTFVLAYLYTTRVAESKTYSAARRAVRNFEKKGVDMQLYAQVEKELGRDLTDVRRRRDAAAARVAGIEDTSNLLGA